jgi:DNA-binding protein YbaB
MATDVNIGNNRDLLGSVAALAQRAGRIRAALTAAVAQGRTAPAGTDESGSITIVLDDEGTARDVRVAEDWRDYLADPEEVAAAVVAADGDAALRRATATADALGRADLDGSTVDGPVPAGWIVPVLPQGAAPAQRRSLSELTAAVLAASDDLARFSEPPPPVLGSAAGGAVRITLAQGRITECTISERWLGHQDDGSLEQALREAVSAAATAGLAARRPFIEYQQRLNALLAEARANLTEMGSRR